ncbi:hypothetical protein ACFPMF_01435 [Larkinella bovis]|uniref:Viral A-type inclusion protein n=1 Tax=Larkinella bovis TaxID=683041 RepID=A0ABW0I786_9BACT
MKRFFNSILPIGFVILGLGCQSANEKTSIEQLQEQVMIVHDEVMPKDEVLMTLKEKITQRMDSLSKITPAPADLKSRQEESIVINQELTDASTLMYDWMNQYKTDTLKGMDNAQAKAYLDAQLQKINVVKEKINGGIDQAEKFLAN